ncbi:MAG TPA: sortase [Candidatus Dormibacteraeota bacterium]|jgi:sortase A
MRRGPLLATAIGALLLLAAVSAVRLVLTPPQLVSLARNSPPALPGQASPLGLPTASPSAAPSASDATQRNAAAVAAGAAPPTAITARISIPRIGIKNAPVYDRGTDAKGVMLIAPGYAVTHYAWSAPVGGGNTVLYGHDDIQGNIFGHLYDLAPGDVIQLNVGGQTQVYRVTGHQIVAPTTVSVLAPTSDVRLTIITCWPFNVDTKRWIVTAVKV